MLSGPGAHNGKRRVLERNSKRRADTQESLQTSRKQTPKRNQNAQYATQGSFGVPEAASMRRFRFLKEIKNAENDWYICWNVCIVLRFIIENLIAALV